MIASNNEASAVIGDTQFATQSAEKSDPSYSLMRYLSDENDTLGHRPARSHAEAEERILEELRKFDEVFWSSGASPSGN